MCRHHAGEENISVFKTLQTCPQGPEGTYQMWWLNWDGSNHHCNAQLFYPAPNLFMCFPDPSSLKTKQNKRPLSTSIITFFSFEQVPIAVSFLQLSTILVESWKILCDLWKLFSLLFSHNTNISTVWKDYTGLPFIWQKRTVFSSWVIHKRSNRKIFTFASFLGSWDIEGICFLLFVPKIWYQYWDYFSATRWHSLSLQLGQEYKPCVFYHTYWDQLRKNTKYCIFQNAFTKTAAEMSHLSFIYTRAREHSYFMIIYQVLKNQADPLDSLKKPFYSWRTAPDFSLKWSNALHLFVNETFLCKFL